MEFIRHRARDTNPSLLWAHTLNNVFASGLGHLERAKGGPPQSAPHRFGWSLDTDGDDQWSSARGPRLGYVLGNGDLLILKDKAYEVVSDLLAATDTPLTDGPTVITRNLAALGAIHVRTELRKARRPGRLRAPRYTVAVELTPRSWVRGIRVRRTWWNKVIIPAFQASDAVQQSESVNRY